MRAWVMVGAIAAALTAAPGARAQAPVQAPCAFLFQLGGDQINLTFPDAGARYWGASMVIPPGGYVEFKGRFPHARYFSLATYDAKTAAIDGIADAAIQPDAGSTNPFLPGADRDAEKRSYTVRLVNARMPASGRAPNTLYTSNADGSKTTYPAPLTGLGMRVYEPDADVDDSGGVGLPKVTLVSADGARVELGGCQALTLPDLGVQQLLAAAGEGVALTGPGLLAPKLPAWRKYTNAAAVLAGYALDNDVTAAGYEAVRAALDGVLPTGGFFENPDNKYVSALVSREHGQVLALRGKLPTTPATRYGSARMGSGQLRYWSLCAFSQWSSLYDCASDEDVPVDRERRFTIVLSTAAARPRNARVSCGVAWLPLGPLPQTVLLLRNMLAAPGFAEAIQNIAVGKEAAGMGAYYPRGTYYRTTAEFERLGCPADTTRRRARR